MNAESVTEGTRPCVLVVEDDDAIRQAIAGALRLDGYRVREVACLAEGRASIDGSLPDLILLDVTLPDGSGLDLLAGLRAAGGKTPVLVLTARGGEEDRVLGFEYGCDDYVVKPFSLVELRLRIQALLRRSGGGGPIASPAGPAIERLGSAALDLAGFRIRRQGRDHRLSPKEKEVLELFLAHPGEVISRERFLREVWGYERCPATRTVDMHVRKLREKIEDDPDAPRHFITVHGAGYRLDP